MKRAWAKTWGNRTVPSYFGTTLPISTPTAYSNNRILGANWGYTARGEINLDPLARTFAYDAEGHIKQTTSANGTAVYSYDAQGRRVRKDTPVGSTVYAYDAFGNLGAEYLTVAQSASCQTCYLTPDHLGSTRVVTGPSGQPVARHDYEPFGGEISFSTSSPRYGIAGYGAPDTDVAPRFTGKERDGETGLDYFGARYFSGAQGRFTSPDAPFADQHPEDPQSWNLYTYARNNPLRYVDPTGMAYCSYGSGSAPEGRPATTEKACTESGGTWVYEPKDTDDPNADAERFFFSTTVTENTGQLSETGQAVVDQLAKNADPSIALIATVAGGSAAVGATALVSKLAV